MSRNRRKRRNRRNRSHYLESVIRQDWLGVAGMSLVAVAMLVLTVRGLVIIGH